MKWIRRHRTTTEHPEWTTDGVEQRDPFLEGHAERVAEYARLILDGLRMHGREAEEVLIAARLHEIGKTHLPTELALARELLKSEDSAHVQMHPERATELMTAHPELPRILEMVRHHHESWNGSGYPSALEGTEIPFGARVIAVADAFDAMTHEHPDRPSLAAERALEILRRGRGRQWDPQIVDALVSSVSVAREKTETARLPRLVDSMLPAFGKIPA
jgi:HD-GYP domain-containing protein (c-di-GMP phosphodiesterase class II)